MSVPMDHLTYNRQQTAAAYRRLADAALIAAEVFSDPDAVPDEPSAKAVVLARSESVAHSLLILAATRTGIARGSKGRAA